MELLGVPLSLPGFVTDLRPHQAEAAEQIVEHFKTKSVVFLDAPTGAGKTLIGEVVRQLVRSGHHGPRLAQCLYVCSSKSLQDQILHDFSYAKVIKGRSNYPTYDQPHLFNEKGARHLDASYCTKVSITRGDLPACDKCEFSHPD